MRKRACCLPHFLLAIRPPGGCGHWAGLAAARQKSRAVGCCRKGVMRPFCQVSPAHRPLRHRRARGERRERIPAGALFTLYMRGHFCLAATSAAARQQAARAQQQATRHARKVLIDFMAKEPSSSVRASLLQKAKNQNESEPCKKRDVSLQEEW